MCRVVIDNEACEDATVVKVLSFPICVRCPTLSMYGGSSLVNWPSRYAAFKSSIKLCCRILGSRVCSVVKSTVNEF